MRELAAEEAGSGWEARASAYVSIHQRELAAEEAGSGWEASASSGQYSLNLLAN
jgi:hypothetical protein